MQKNVIYLKEYGNIPKDNGDIPFESLSIQTDDNLSTH